MSQEYSTNGGTKICGKKLAGTSNWFEDKLCCLLNKLEYNHCSNSLGE
jgi:hypothetical protein